MSLVQTKMSHALTFYYHIHMFKVQFVIKTFQSKDRFVYYSQRIKIALLKDRVRF